MSSRPLTHTESERCGFLLLYSIPAGFDVRKSVTNDAQLVRPRHRMRPPPGGLADPSHRHEVVIHPRVVLWGTSAQMGCGRAQGCSPVLRSAVSRTTSPSLPALWSLRCGCQTRKDDECDAEASGRSSDAATTAFAAVPGRNPPVPLGLRRHGAICFDGTPRRSALLCLRSTASHLAPWRA